MRSSCENITEIGLQSLGEGFEKLVNLEKAGFFFEK